jgi:lipopolysaccharide cholinephosphotransferase
MNHLSITILILLIIFSILMYYDYVELCRLHNTGYIVHDNLSEQDIFKNHQEQPESHNFKITDPRNVTQLYQLVYILDKILIQNNIEYWMDGGTMLGAMRHNGIIPWDDDGDVEIWATDKIKLESLKPIFDKYGIVLMNTWFGYKIFFKTGAPIKGYKWLYPAIDIFTMKHDNGKVVFSEAKAQSYFGHCTFDYNLMYPLQRYKFGSFELNGVARDEAHNYLDRCYRSDWPDYAYQMYDHSKEQKIEKVKVKLTDDDLKPAYPIEFDKTHFKSFSR